MTDDRCADCGYLLKIHFRPITGTYRGCPWRTCGGLAEQRLYPRVTIRSVRAGPRKGHIVVGWIDCLDDGAMPLWDLETGEQWTAEYANHFMHTALVKGWALEAVKDRVELEVGGPVRVLVRVKTLTPDG